MRGSAEFAVGEFVDAALCQVQRADCGTRASVRRSVQRIQALTHLTELRSELAGATAAEAELLDSALTWRSATGGQRLWIVLVLHKERSRLIRAPGEAAGGMRYVETVLLWTRFMDLARGQQQRIIVERVDQVLDEMARRALESSK